MNTGNSMKDVMQCSRVLEVRQLNSSDKSPYKDCRLVRYIGEDDNTYSVIVDNITGKDIFKIETLEEEATILVKFGYTLKSI